MHHITIGTYILVLTLNDTFDMQTSYLHNQNSSHSVEWKTIKYLILCIIYPTGERAAKSVKCLDYRGMKYKPIIPLTKSPTCSQLTMISHHQTQSGQFEKWLYIRLCEPSDTRIQDTACPTSRLYFKLNSCKYDSIKILTVYKTVQINHC